MESQQIPGFKTFLIIWFGLFVGQLIDVNLERIPLQYLKSFHLGTVGRGIGLLYIVLGLATFAATAIAYAYTPLRNLETLLPDRLPEQPARE